jgi:septum formation protein
LPSPSLPLLRPRFVLASSSPARLRLLRAAGLDPEVIPSDVPEDLPVGTPVAAAVAELAERKATAVASRPDLAGALVLGCDSLLELGGAARGKPEGPGEALERWGEMAGNVGVLHTGHCLVDTGSGRAVTEVVRTTVRFARPGPAELEAYLATGEPLAAAGAFTLDGYSAPFVESIEGDYGNVIGVSLPLLRTLLQRLGHEVTSLWA